MIADLGPTSRRFLTARLLTTLGTKVSSKIALTTFESKPLAIFGAGELGRLALEFCSACGSDVQVVLETNPKGETLGFGNKTVPVCPVNGFPEASRNKIDVLVAVSTTPFVPIKRFLEDHGYSNVIPFMDIVSKPQNAHPLTNGWRVGEVSPEELRDVEQVCNLWHDKASLEHYEAFVRWHVDSTEVLPQLVPIDPLSRYVIPQLKKFISSRHIQFVDVGACRGESLERLTKSSILFDQYILVEPDEDNREQLIEKCRYLGIDPSRLRVVDALLASEVGEVTFAKRLGYCSQIWSGGDVVRSTLRLDDLGVTPDVIKIHTEGNEAEIVRGGLETISTYRPALIVAVYHNRNGLSKAILDIADECIEYSWSFRLHAFQGTGAFIYGFPKDV